MKRLLLLLLLLLLLPMFCRAEGLQNSASPPSPVTTVPLINTSASNLLATLASGSTFYSMVTDGAIILKRICVTVVVPSVAGTGDIFTVGNGTNSLSVTSASAAAVGARTCSSLGSISIASGSALSVRIDSDAATKPVVTVNYEYTVP